MNAEHSDLADPITAIDRSPGVPHARDLGLVQPAFQAALDDEIYRQRVRDRVGALL